MSAAPVSRTALRLSMAGISLAIALGAGILAVSWAQTSRLDRRIRAEAAELAVSPQTFNIYYFGESSMAGEPYAPQASIPRIIEHLLGGVAARRPIRSINLAQPGTDVRFTVERVRDVIRNRDVTHPSLCVFYLGHNEFLKYQSRIPRVLLRLPAPYTTVLQRVDGLFPAFELDDRRLLDAGIVDARSKEAVIDEYKASMRQAMALLREHNVPAIVSTVPSNYSDWEPNRSVFVGSASEAEQLARLIDRGRSLELSHDAAAAVQVYESARTVSDDVAEVHYRLGVTYRALGRIDEAWRAFQRAVDTDAMPIRATSAINEFLVTLQDASHVSVVDAVGHLREASGERLIGSDLMIDGHHPTLDGYVRIAQLIASEIRRTAGATGQGAVTASDAAREFGVDREKEFEVAISRGRWFTKLATWRYDPAARLERAETFFRSALEDMPSRYEPHLGLAMVEFLRGNAAQAERYLTAARTLNAEAVDQYFRETWVRRVRERAYSLPAGKPVHTSARTEQ